MYRLSLYSILPFLFISLFADCVAAQNNEAFFDSIPVASFDHKILKFKLNDSLLKEVSFPLSRPKKVKIKTKHILGDVGKGMLTLISGFGLENSKYNQDLRFDAKIESKESKSGWEVDLYCKGDIGTELDRYRTEEGGVSLSVDHYAYVDWDQGASGKILKDNSQIGEFVLIKYPKNTEESSKEPLEFLDELKKKNSDEETSEAENIGHPVSNDFAIIGKLYGVDFKVVTNMRKQKYWIFQDQTTKAIVQTSVTRNSFGKNYHLLLNPEISIWESTYWTKISLLALFLNRTIQTDHYKW